MKNLDTALDSFKTIKIASSKLETKNKKLRFFSEFGEVHFFRNLEVIIKWSRIQLPINKEIQNIKMKRNRKCSFYGYTWGH